MGWIRLGAVILGLAAGSALATQPCSKKRVDACGCHHVYGIRHCHPNRRSKHCELPAKGDLRFDAHGTALVHASL